jgi:hypothetical protein
MLSGLTGASEEHGAGLRITGQPPSPLLEELAAAAGVAAAVDTNTEAEPLCMTGHPLTWLEASAGGGVLPPVALQVLSARRPPANHDIVTSVSADLLFDIATKWATCSSFTASNQPIVSGKEVSSHVDVYRLEVLPNSVERLCL